MKTPDPRAKDATAEYQRNLPHIQKGGKPIFVTFATKGRWELPASVRSIALQHCLHDHNRKVYVHAAVVMPDHVHLLMTLLEDVTGQPFGLAEVLGGIKGASAHIINRALGRIGHVWQDESFDHLPRSDEALQEKAEYLCNNPVRKGLVNQAEEYPWLWCDGMPLPE